MQGHPFLSYFLGEVIFYFKVPAKKLYMTSFVVNISTASSTLFTKSGFYPKKCSATKVIGGKLNKGNFFNALNIIITSQHGISLSVTEIISCSLWILNGIFYWLYLSVSFFNLSGNAWSWEWTNAQVYQLDVSWLLASPILVSFRALDFKNRSFILAGRTV